ncbi:MAG: hypothetical protein LBP35_07130 [Candidatus Ancillula trichonymphae]|nr:hypothetical protein [Candidatus Ancillula trichonymphae]
MLVNQKYFFNTKQDYKWSHLSLCVLEVLFENDALTTTSVKPLIKKYADFANLQDIEDLENHENFKEQTLSQLLQSITDMNATNREAIFNQKNLSSLATFISMLIKRKIEVLDDLKAVLGDEEKVKTLGDKIKRLGYVNRFINAVMSELLGRQEIVMEKEKRAAQAESTRQVVGQRQVGGRQRKRIVPQVIQTKSHKIKLYPTLNGGMLYGVLAISSLVLAIILAVAGSGFLSTFNVSIDAQCINAVAQGAQVTSICTQNETYLNLGYVLFGVTGLVFILGTGTLTQFVRLQLHNKFVGVHNAFELTHYELTKR